MIFDTIPTSRPLTPLLDTIEKPSALKALSVDQLTQVANELRAFMLYCVGQSGGHFGAGLGVIELTVALHAVLDTPQDKLIWDVGHQSYPHKILTGRRERMVSMRQPGGLAAFPKREESEYDSFGVGHSSTSISAALGMAIARDLNQQSHHCVAVIGDGAITAGMAYEALNHAGHTKTNMLIVLNDNSMSISENTGGLSAFLANLKDGQTEPALIPSPTIFEDLGLSYLGPVNGHNLAALKTQLAKALAVEGPVLLHVKTQKGHGYTPALNDPVAYHALTKIEAQNPPLAGKHIASEGMKYQDVFGSWLCHTAEHDEKLIGITPAMKEGSGMTAFATQYPERFYDVAIAEQHALTFAAGSACGDRKPVVAIYSTFLQRAYDQLIHDIALQKLDVTLAIDRAGLVGEDGPTHAGAFDLSFLRCIPEVIIAAPSNEHECFHLLNAAYAYSGPAAVRYPRGRGPGSHIDKGAAPFQIGKARPVRQGTDVCILNFGALSGEAIKVADKCNYTVVDMRWVKPLDGACIRAMIDTHKYIVTLEENVLSGGAGSAVQEFLAQENLSTALICLGLPDAFSDCVAREDLLKTLGLDAEGIEKQIHEAIVRWDRV